LMGHHPFYKSPAWKVYGPYQRETDLRRHVIAYDGIHRITISYPKFIMECKPNRLLMDNEEVHHRNSLEFNDRIDNYEIVSVHNHRSNHLIKLPEYFICPVCNEQFILEGKRLSWYKTERKRNPFRKGPYCSKSCSGKVNN